MSRGQIVFSHGQESGPWGTKIRAMASTAQAEGWAVESIDYQGMPDPRARASRLIDWCNERSVRPVLVGSSMGGFVSVAAAEAVKARGLFLLAPALYLPGFEEHLPAPPRCPTQIVHGWNDDVVPWQGSLRFAEQTQASLQILNSDHRLTDAIVTIQRTLAGFLGDVDA